jgi:hypothetical protein
MRARVTGQIIRGERNAQSNNAVLIPILAKHFPEIAKCSQFGTINVQLSQPLDRSHADVWTPRVIWNPIQMALKERRIEAFGFIKIKFECPLNGPAHDCWIILPEGSKLTYREDRVEIIAGNFIQAVEYGAACAIDIDHSPATPAPRSFGTLYGMSLPIIRDSI